MTDQAQPDAELSVFAPRGSAELVGRINAFDWAHTPLGSLASWPASLRTALSILLGSRFPMQLLWGPEYIHFYNDAYLPIAADKHPFALGRPGAEIWPEVWDVVGPMLDQVRATGEATWSDDQLLVLNRNGALEEGYFTFSYGPIAGDTGEVDGIFIAVTETTRRVIGERRLRLVRDLGTALMGVADEPEVIRRAQAALASGAADLPYALLYLLDDQRNLRLAGASGIDAEHPAAPATLALNELAGPWPLAAALSASQPTLVDTPADLFGALPGGPWDAPARAALLLPLLAPTALQPVGVLVAGLSPRLRLDEDYHEFLGRIASQIGGAIHAARSQAAIEAALRVRDDFLSTAAHELKNPLTPILGRLQLLRRRLAQAGVDAHHTQAVDALAGDVWRLTAMVDSLLDLSRLRSGQLDIEHRPVDLGAVAQSIVAESQPTLGNHTLTLRMPEHPVVLSGDALRLEQVVRNLVSNAVKYSPSGGEIVVGVQRAGDHAQISVADPGVGIAPEVIPYLFQRYYRDQSVQDIRGLGIGLYVVHEIVRLHGGTVRVDSQLGAGSVFTITLPLVG
jgi:signal transduction histidine kinase